MLLKGRYRARPAEGPEDLAACQRLRHEAFITRAGLPGRPGGLEADGFDARARHMMVEELAGGRLVATFRLMHLASGADIGLSYAAQFYDLAGLSGFTGPMVEMGRFCMAPGLPDAADVLRIAWGAMTREVEAAGAEMLFGCTSFAGTGAEAHRAAFGYLAERHLAPERYRPGAKAAEVVAFGGLPGGGDPRAGLLALPPLLRTYLTMGGWVSDHAVVDRELGTLHVFTGVETRAIPAARARALRAVAS
ncbi:GNAT family N-acetyltransferase [Pseudoroseicyclus sp. CXY001]|uniref:GNAT family N-acetyltransferase n=1 Tax=Pseudoroseicyclus sp. CXY001 TaxID=3242492 RepID=UPI00358DC828